MNRESRGIYTLCPDCPSEETPALPDRREFFQTVGRTVGGIVLAPTTARIMPVAA